jgi:hypothetical protein
LLQGGRALSIAYLVSQLITPHNVHAEKSVNGNRIPYYVHRCVATISSSDHWAQVVYYPVSYEAPASYCPDPTSDNSAVVQGDRDIFNEPILGVDAGEPVVVTSGHLSTDEYYSTP